MKRKLSSLFFGLLALFLLVSGGGIVDAAKIKSVPPTNYPGTSIAMKAGDVLYSSKGFSTFFVGHAGIIGSDYRVYHSHPNGPGISETIESYISRHNSGDTIKVLRPSQGTKAASWAQSHIGDIKSYAPYNIDLNDVSINYCSKFVWQAFWYGYGIDLTPRNLTDKSHDTIYPIQIRDSSKLSSQGSIKVP